MEGKHIVVSGPIIIEDNKLLTVKEGEDEFYKLPGGTSEEDEELEETCKREIKEEINGEIEIIKPLNPKVLWENPHSKEKMTIMPTSYLAKLKNKQEIKTTDETDEIVWLDLKDIDEWKHKVSPYTQFLIEKGDIK